MSGTLKGFDGLAPLGRQLQGDQEKARVLALITSCRPDENGCLHRAGKNKRGHWCWYAIGQPGPGELCSNTEAAALNALLAAHDERVIVFRRGNAGVALLFHIEEPW